MPVNITQLGRLIGSLSISLSIYMYIICFVVVARRARKTGSPHEHGEPDAKRRHHPAQKTQCSSVQVSPREGSPAQSTRKEKGEKAGWRCSCNPRSCRAVVGKTGQRPPVGAPPHPTTTRGVVVSGRRCVVTGSRPGLVLQAPQQSAMPGGSL